MFPVPSDIGWKRGREQETERDRGRERERKRDRETNRHRQRQTETQTHRQTYPGHRKAVSSTLVFHFSPPNAGDRETR